jgi:uncharacterized membrane protein YoaK (UPF0700 family)
VPDNNEQPHALGRGKNSGVARVRAVPLPGIIFGVYAVTATAGLLDAASFLGLGHVFVETMTGNVIFLAFTVGSNGPGYLPYLYALGAFAVGAVAAGRLVRMGHPGRRAGFTATAILIGVAVLVTALTHPGPVGHTRDPVIAILSAAMGIQNALMRKWGVPDLATNVVTLTLAALLAESTLGGGSNPRAARRAASILLFAVSAGAGAFLSRYGVLWPMLAAFAVFALALPILLQKLSD